MNSDTPVIDYAAVLADLESRRAQLDVMIAGVRTMMLGMPATSGATPSNGGGAPPTSTEIESDTFFSLSIPDAAKKFLGMRKKPATTGEIGDALRRGGQTHAIGSNSPEVFNNTLNSILNRAYRSGAGVVKVGRSTWGLADWYPNKPRKPARAQKGDSPSNGITDEDSSQADGDSE